MMSSAERHLTDRQQTQHGAPCAVLLDSVMLFSSCPGFHFTTISPIHLVLLVKVVILKVYQDMATGLNSKLHRKICMQSAHVDEL